MISLGFVIVGEEEGAMVGDADPTSQSTAAPGSSGGMHLDGAAEKEGIPLGRIDGAKLGPSDAVTVGTNEGDCDGAAVGFMDFTIVGVAEAVADGLADAAADGAAESTCSLLSSSCSISLKRTRSLGGGQGYSKTSRITYL
jgi:hypothetical protein